MGIRKWLARRIHYKWAYVVFVAFGLVAFVHGVLAGYGGGYFEGRQDREEGWLRNFRAGDLTGAMHKEHDMNEELVARGYKVRLRFMLNRDAYWTAYMWTEDFAAYLLNRELFEGAKGKSVDVEQEQ